MPEALPRDRGLGALMKTIAESTQLTTLDAQAVLDKLLSTLIVRAARGVRIHMPPGLF